MTENHTNITTIRAIIASPGDVEQERQTVREVIIDVNKTLESMGRSYRIQVIEQKDVAPGVGNAEEKIIEHFEIDNAHLFIGIFWRKFGKPPQMARTDDGLIYLSGTQAEIYAAFSAREKKNSLQPEIMIYRRTDMPKRALNTADEEAIIQYGNVLSFFKELESNIKYKALYQKFEGKEFREILRNNLIQVCSRNEDKWLGDNPTLKPSLLSDKANLDPEERWIARSPLKFNPFTDNLFEKTPIEEYAIASCGLADAKRLIWDKNLVYVFGDKGSGKTTLLENTLRSIENKIYKDAIGTDDIYCLRIDSNHLVKQLENIGDISQYKNYHFTKLIYELVTGGLESVAQRHLPKPEVDFSKPTNTLTELIKWLKQYKYSSLLCMVDGIDEIYHVKHSEAPDSQAINLLRSIVITNIDNFRLRLFLTSNLKDLMRNENNYFRLDRFHIIDLEWEKSMLREMINQRLQVASRTGAILTLSEFCPENPAIEVEMAEYATKNPRAMLWLAKELFQAHVLQADATEFIKSVSWEKVKKEWEKRKSDFIYPNDKKDFWIGNNQTPFFRKTEIPLSPILSKILCCLIDAKGEICESEKLIRAAYPPNEDPRYLMKTFYQQMGNLKKELDEITPGWLQNVRGKGYRLLNPGSKSQEVKL